MLDCVKKYFSLVRFAHTVFALPFALTGFVYALTSTEHVFDYGLLGKMLLCMVFARNTAMGFNRYADRFIDALNPRTAHREIPAGVIASGKALWFVVINAGAFVTVSFFINPWVFFLSPIALTVLLAYSYSKRFTPLCHFVLGLAMSIAPMGAYMAVTGSFALVPLVLSAVVLFWGAGFDIIYALQDIEFDRAHKLYSIPSSLGAEKALRVSSASHILAAAGVLLIGFIAPWGLFYWLGAAFFLGMLGYQHLLVKPDDLSKVNAAFFTSNGLASIGFATLLIIDLLV